jgi:2-polyprenyl-3-methyl-5-hydroxy-6-metoxy-1,4-benzoquinol methylase
MENYLEINKSAWNKKVPFHLESEFYDHENFLKGKQSLKEIELGLLGDVQGKKILHLQCHFGQDSISLARMGAEVTGVDFSEAAIEVARNTSKNLGLNIRFICSDLYQTNNVLDEKFDVVFATYGTIGWLPDMERWAKLIRDFLKPSGKLVFAEFHPAVWMLNDEFSEISYSYFNTGPIVETYSGSYADKKADLKEEFVMWNHSISEVLGALLAHGLAITQFHEYDFSPYPCFSNVVEVEPEKFMIQGLEKKLPMVYAFVAEVKRG